MGQIEDNPTSKPYADVIDFEQKDSVSLFQNRNKNVRISIRHTQSVMGQVTCALDTEDRSGTELYRKLFHSARMEGTDKIRRETSSISSIAPDFARDGRDNDACPHGWPSSPNVVRRS